MFNALTNLAKAAVAVTLAPVAAVVDTIAPPFDATDGATPYNRTAELLRDAGECVSEAVKPQKE